MVGGVELLVEGCWLVRGCLGAAATGQGATRGCRALRSATGVDGAGYPLEERVSHAGSFSGSYWCPHRGVVILGRQRGCGVSWGLAVAQVPFPVLWPPARLGCDVGMWGFGEGVRIGWLG